MSHSGKAGELAGVHVLVVDDDRDSLEMMQAALSYAGALVTAVDSARQAFTVLNAATPNVIVSDLRMPDTDGLTFARELRTMPALDAIPILAVTGYDELYARSELHAAGFIGILRKPLAFLDLVRTVAALADAGGPPSTAPA
jgi:CheY-like chemotaxis protein